MDACRSLDAPELHLRRGLTIASHLAWPSSIIHRLAHLLHAVADDPADPRLDGLASEILAEELAARVARRASGELEYSSPDDGFLFGNEWSNVELRRLCRLILGGLADRPPAVARLCQELGI